MAGATLSDQMGAMALIDELRHRKMVVQEHLDMPRRREEVAQRIREYYRSRSIEVGEDIIDQGVRDYFDRRLAHEVPVTSKWKAALANAYISRAAYKMPAAVTLASVLALSGVGYGVATLSESMRLDEVRTELLAAQTSRVDILGRVTGQKDALKDLLDRLAAKPLPVGSRILAPVPEMIGAVERRLSSVRVPSDVTPNNADTVRAQGKQAVTDFSEMANATLPVAKILGEGQILLDARDNLETITSHLDYRGAVAIDPTLLALEKDARQSIAIADVIGAQKAADHVQALKNAIGASIQIGAVQAYRQKFDDLGLAPEEMKQVYALIAAGIQHVKSRNLGEIDKAVLQLESLYTFARTPLTLSIADRVGVKSGVERKYNGSGGKSWYLVVEATDPAGNVVPVPVASAETGMKVEAKIFGVRVTQDEYERVKADKKADGHVDDRQIGKKQANSLTIAYGRDIGSSPDVILEW